MRVSWAKREVGSSSIGSQRCDQTSSQVVHEPRSDPHKLPSLRTESKGVCAEALGHIAHISPIHFTSNTYASPISRSIVSRESEASWLATFSYFRIWSLTRSRADRPGHKRIAIKRRALVTWLPDK